MIGYIRLGSTTGAEKKCWVMTFFFGCRYRYSYIIVYHGFIYIARDGIIESCDILGECSVCFFLRMKICGTENDFATENYMNIILFRHYNT